MTIRNALLALLHDGAKHGYHLKAEFEASQRSSAERCSSSSASP